MTTLWTAAPGAYGLRQRVRVVRRQGRTDPSLLRWYPTWQVLDPYGFLDLTTVWEQAWVTRWVATRDRPRGALVELGAWLGATTRAIARGAADRDDLHVYDTFVFDDIEGRVAGTPLESRHRDGDPFRDLFERRHRGHLDGTVLHEGDVLGARWEGGPIELLFVDLAKTWETWDHVLGTFLRHVVAGGIVVQQDWAHANTPWLHLWHHRWRDHFTTVGQIAHSGSVVFAVAEALPAEAFDPHRLDAYRPEEVRAAFAWAASLVDPGLRPNVVGAEIMVHALHGRPSDGVEVLLERAATVPVTQDLARVAIPELARRTAEERSDPLAPRPLTPGAPPTRAQPPAGSRSSDRRD